MESQRQKFAQAAVLLLSSADTTPASTCNHHHQISVDKHRWPWHVWHIYVQVRPSQRALQQHRLQSQPLEDSYKGVGDKGLQRKLEKDGNGSPVKTVVIEGYAN